jgi:hypothetical protein
MYLCLSFATSALTILAISIPDPNPEKVIGVAIISLVLN